MTDEPKPDKGSDREVDQAKGAAREAIGKLIGDDAEVRKGQRQQAGKPATRGKRPSQE